VSVTETEIDEMRGGLAIYELGSARRWARAWKKAAALNRRRGGDVNEHEVAHGIMGDVYDAMLEKKNKRIAALEDALREVEDLLSEVVRRHMDDLLPRENFWRECGATAETIRALLESETER